MKAQSPGKWDQANPQLNHRGCLAHCITTTSLTVPTASSKNLLRRLPSLRHRQKSKPHLLALQLEAQARIHTNSPQAGASTTTCAPSVNISRKPMDLKSWEHSTRRSMLTVRKNSFCADFLKRLLIALCTASASWQQFVQSNQDVFTEFDFQYTACEAESAAGSYFFCLEPRTTYSFT